MDAPHTMTDTTVMKNLNDFRHLTLADIEKHKEMVKLREREERSQYSGMSPMHLKRSGTLNYMTRNNTFLNTKRSDS